MQEIPSRTTRISVMSKAIPWIQMNIIVCVEGVERRHIVLLVGGNNCDGITTQTVMIETSQLTEKFPFFIFSFFCQFVFGSFNSNYFCTNDCFCLKRSEKYEKSCFKTFWSHFVYFPAIWKQCVWPTHLGSNASSWWSDIWLCYNMKMWDLDDFSAVVL